MAITSKQTLSQTLSPIMYQYMDIIQLNTLELGGYLMQQATDNPIIDMDLLCSSPAFHNIKNSPAGKANIVEKRSFHVSADNNDIQDDNFDTAYKGMTVREYLRAMIAPLKLSPEKQLACRYLIGCVGEKGYLDEQPEDVAAELNISESVANSCLELLRSFQPTGICAKDMRHCLLTQANYSGNTDLIIIIENHLDDIACGHYQAISKATGFSVHKIKALEQELSRLNPIPASRFFSDNDIYIEPDIVVDTAGEHAEIRILSNYSSYLGICTYYDELRRSTDDPDVLEYLERQYSSASILFSNIRQYEKNLELCAAAIMSTQQHYFSNPNAVPAPMLMTDIAEQIGVSVSTVSRMVAGKYIQCCHGVLSLRRLFSRELSPTSSACVSAEGVKSLLSEVINAEDRSAPLSDEQLCSILGGHGISISRRTVAKYRTELGIPSTFKRKIIS